MSFAIILDFPVYAEMFVPASLQGFVLKCVCESERERLSKILNRGGFGYEFLFIADQFL